jgi:hypothetical protein
MPKSNLRKTYVAFTAPVPNFPSLRVEKVDCTPAGQLRAQQAIERIEALLRRETGEY